jgi:hypothetical protein
MALPELKLDDTNPAHACSAVLRWLEVILAERFGHAWTLCHSAAGLVLRLNGGEGQITFDTIQACFGESRSDLPFTTWEAAAEEWESLLGRPLPAPGAAKLPAPLIEKNPAGLLVHYDVLGLTYWMLARVEEMGRTDLDSHGRFPASASHAFKHGYLDRPIVDEWLHVLGQAINRQWLGIELKKHNFRFELSHDVDRPSRYLFGTLAAAMRSAASDVVKRGDVLAPLRAVWLRQSSPDSLHPSDPYNTFEWLMDISERHGVKSTFYFMAGCTNPSFDAKYDIGHPAIRKLLRLIHDRGHLIGLHPSYECYCSGDQIRGEAQALWSVCQQEKIRQDVWGARMHCLRWTCPKTPRLLESAGLSYDSTVGYADHPGFRCGTSMPYSFFDSQIYQKTKLQIRPLILMESSVIAERYCGMGSGHKALRAMRHYYNTCKMHQGHFSLLWHNCHLTERCDRRLYRTLLEDRS